MDIAAIRRHRWELLRFRVTEAVSGRGHAIRIARVIRDLVLSERSTTIVKLYGSASCTEEGFVEIRMEKIQSNLRERLLTVIK